MSTNEQIALEPIAMSGGGVALRRLVADDALALWKICQDPVTIQWTTIPTPYSEEHARSFVENPPPCLWAIVNPDDQQDLWGTIDLRLVSGFRASVGYMTAPWARGRGVMTAALRLVRDYAFSNGVQRFELHAYPENAASRRVAEKVDMRFEGVLRNAEVQRGELRDIAVYSSIPADLL